MNRRQFLKVISAITGSAAMPAWANELPVEIPEDWSIAIGAVNNGFFHEMSRVTVKEFVDANPRAIMFPSPSQRCTVSHVSINGRLVKLDHDVTLDYFTQPMFPVGSLVVEES